MPAAVALLLGIAIHGSLPPYPSLWIICLLTCVITAVAAFARPMACAIAIIVGLFVAGASLGQLDAFFYPRDHVSSFASERPRPAMLELQLDHPPRVLTWQWSSYRALPPKQVATASVRRIKTWSGWIESGGDVLVQIAQPHPRLAQGQIIRIIGLLERPGPAMNPGQFDWARYYREQRILASVHIAQADGITILQQRPIGPIARLRHLTRQALAMGFPASRSLDHALLRALLLGDNDPELRDVQEQFRRTGTSHHLAISGMHVAVLGGVVFGACRLLRVGPRAACWTSLVFVVTYGLAALPSPPVVRSIILCSCFAFGVLQRRSIDGIQLLAVTIIAMLIYHPMDLYNAGFQLSFGTVLGLMIFTRPLASALMKRDPDRAIAMALAPPSSAAWLRMRLMRGIGDVAAASIVAWVVSMPLIAYHFEQLNPWAIPASIILAPFVFTSLIGGFAKVLMTLLWPGLAGTWASLAAAPVAGMRHTVDWLATFPGADVPLPAPPSWMLLAFYALLGAMLLRPARPALRWSIRTAAAMGCAVLAWLPVRAGLAMVGVDGGEMKMTLLAIGAGQCAVIEPPGHYAVLIDAGSATLSDVLRKALGPFLRHQGRRDIATVFVSHANYDHFAAVAEIAAAYAVQRVLVSPQFSAQSAGNPLAENLLRALEALDRSPQVILPAARFDLGGGASIEVLWPGEQCELGANDSSQVLRLSFAGRTILFCGDIQDGAQRELMRLGSIAADVLIAPHHGAADKTTAQFIAAVNPSAILCSNDRTLSARQMRFDRLVGGRALYRTHTSGAITVRITRDGRMSIEPYLAPRPAASGS